MLSPRGCTQQHDRSPSLAKKSTRMPRQSWVDTVEKGFTEVVTAGIARKRFPDPDPERNDDSERAPSRNWILSVDHIISGESDFFDSIGHLSPCRAPTSHGSSTPDSCPSCCIGEIFCLGPICDLCRCNNV